MYRLDSISHKQLSLSDVGFICPHQ